MKIHWALDSFFILLLIATDLQASAERVTRSFYLMGTHLEVQIEGSDHNQSMAATEAIFEAVTKAEKRLSTWDDKSELSRLNHTPVGQKFVPSDLLKRDLDLVYKYARETDYNFDPAVGPLVKAWDLRGSGRVPTDKEVKEAVEASRSSNFVFSTQGTTRKFKSAALEEGGFGKGQGLDDALIGVEKFHLKKLVMDFGGQVSVLSETPVEVGVANPNKRDEILLRLTLMKGSVSTSGNSEKGRQVGKRFVGHILDPFTGEPATFSGSVTVVSDSGLEADCFSTGLFVMGPSRGLSLVKRMKARSQRRLGAVFLERSGSKWLARASCDLKKSLKISKSEVFVQYDCGEQ